MKINRETKFEGLDWEDIKIKGLNLKDKNHPYNLNKEEKIHLSTF